MMTEKLQAIRAKCERMLAHAEREPGQFMASQVAAYKSTIKACDICLSHSHEALDFIANGIIAAWAMLEAVTLPIPRALYPCHFCREAYSWPAEDLYWCAKVNNWVCCECWDGEAFGDRGVSLEKEIARHRRHE